MRIPTRRRFLGSGVVTAALVASSVEGSPADPSTPSSEELSNEELTKLRDHYHNELFEVQLPFWDDHGIDHELGGFMTALDYGGTRLNDQKYHWYQGRGIWVYSYLYNQMGIHLTQVF